MELYVTLPHNLKNWVAGTPVRQQPLWNEHAAFMDCLCEAGKVTLAGPFPDGSGALVIIRNENEQEVHAILDDDPWVREEMLDGGEVRPWQMFLNALDQSDMPNS